MGIFLVILNRVFYLTRALKKQNEKKTSTPPYVKVTLSPRLHMALNIISENTGTTRTAIGCHALEHYFKNQFPEVLPKSEGELMIKVKERLDIEKYEQEYKHDKFVVKSIPGYEEEQKELIEKINRVKGDIISIDQKIKSKQNDTEELKKLKTKKQEFMDKKNNLQWQLDDSRRHLKNLIRRKAYIS